jgi:hypothetical protein
MSDRPYRGIPKNHLAHMVEDLANAIGEATEGTEGRRSVCARLLRLADRGTDVAWRIEDRKETDPAGAARAYLTRVERSGLLTYVCHADEETLKVRAALLGATVVWDGEHLRGRPPSWVQEACKVPARSRR